MTLWWIGDVLLIVVVLPVVVYLLKGVLDAARSIEPSVASDRRGGRGGVEGPRRGAAAPHDAGAGEDDGRGRRRLRRLSRRDRRRRGGGVAMPAAGVVLIVAVLLIVLALVYYLVSTIVALRKITTGLDDAIAVSCRDHRQDRPGRRSRQGHQREPRRGRGPARGPAREEGRAGGLHGPGRGAVSRAPPPRACATSPTARRCGRRASRRCTRRER